MNELTQVEKEALAMVAEGFTNAQIASSLHYSVNYVEGGRGGLMGRIYTKLGIYSFETRSSCMRAKAVAIGFREGILK